MAARVETEEKVARTAAAALEKARIEDEEKEARVAAAALRCLLPTPRQSRAPAVPSRSMKDRQRSPPARRPSWRRSYSAGTLSPRPD